jgi:hypothetical protein
MELQWNSDFTTNTELAGKPLRFVQSNSFCILFAAMMCLNDMFMLCFSMTSQARQLWYRVWRDHNAGVGVFGRACPGVSILSCR